jgi:hypothetical protein
VDARLTTLNLLMAANGLSTSRTLYAVYPMAPKLKERVSLQSERGAHWLTFDLKGDFSYVAPTKNSDDGTEIFNAHTHTSVGLIGSSEDMIEIDFPNGKISRVGDQYGIGRVARD